MRIRAPTAHHRGGIPAPAPPAPIGIGIIGIPPVP
ncbi:hypothetical protein I546_5835, partial [Mycobacterium kansasii 732]